MGTALDIAADVIRVQVVEHIPLLVHALESKQELDHDLFDCLVIELRRIVN